MSLRIIGLGTAVPPRRIDQLQAAGLAVELANARPGRERALTTLYRQSGVRSRASVLLEPPDGRPYAQSFFPPASTSGAGPSTGARMARYEAEAGRLASEAAAAALAAGGVEAAAVTHLVTCSCTGFASPGFDLELCDAFDLAPSVARTHVGFMGCHGAFNALRVADAFVAADPAAVALVACVELCSLHFQYGGMGDHLVANSLFADGAAALVGVGDRRRADDRGWRVVRQTSRRLPGSAADMSWRIGDSGFEMTLSARVPAVVAERIPDAVADLLAPEGLSIADVSAWAVHPGGPRILTAVEESLALGTDALAASRGILADHGNMSSATILFVLERLVAAGATGPCVAMAFGPGLTAELALLTREPDPVPSAPRTRPNPK